MPRPRNALKTIILKFLLANGESTALTISQGLNEEIHSVHNALLRLQLNRLVMRKKGSSDTGYHHNFAYSIKQKGRDRLEYYAKKAQEAQEVK